MAEETPSHPTEQPIDPSLHPLRDALRDRYILEAEIGAGGMGTVLRARDLKHSRTVAIKVLRSDMARSIGADRFHREIQTAARLMHPNIITVFDSGSAADMLYFVMPYVAGESLRDRLNREGRLPVDDAVRITSQLAGALRYAHDSGVVHRDIKPENILLSDGHAWLVDFGVAQAAASSRDTRLTTTGLIVGSPQYVSPEQARGEGEVDGRADLYSLGCVLYEMLAGRAPFEGKTLEATLLGHMTQPPPALPSHVPPYLAQVVTIVLAKQPEDRFQNASELESALGGLLPRRRRFRRRASRPVVYGVAVVLVAIPVVLLGQRWLSTRTVAASDAPVNQFDTTRYAVLQIDADTALQALRIPQLLTDALGEWTDIDVVDQSRIGAVESLNVGRAITGSVSSYGDSVRIYLELADRNRPGVTLAKARATAVSRAALGASLKRAVDQLLATGVSPECTRGQIGTRSLRALHACDQAFSALQDGDREFADSMFATAARIDETYARPALWLALLRAWLRVRPPDTRPLLNVAAVHAEQLDVRERDLLEGQRLIDDGKFNQACEVFTRLVQADSADFAAWLGLGDCHARDNAVVDDPSSPTGFSFRSSYQQAAKAYVRAFELRPSLLGGYSERSFSVIRNVLFTSTDAIRRGYRLNNATEEFATQASWDADTLSFRPFRLTEYGRTTAVVRPVSIEIAVDRQRQQFLRLVSRWTTAQERSSAAWSAMAVAYEMNADPRALEMIRRSRANAVTEPDKQRLAASEAVLRLKFSLPDDIDGVREAARLADSLLTASEPEPGATRSYIGLALMLGRPDRAAQLARAESGRYADREGLPAGAAHPAEALIVFAVAGAPADSIHRLEQEVASAIRNSVAPELQPNARAALLAHAAMVAAPNHPFESITDLEEYILILQAARAWRNKDQDSVLKVLRRITAVRGDMRPADLAIDALFVEAWLMAAIGDIRGAISHIDPTLNAVRWLPPGGMDYVRLASLVRAMALRAELASRISDEHAARRWAAPVAALWARPDPAMTGLVRRMKLLSKP